MNRAERRALRDRYDFRCGYCGVRESEVGAELTADHFQPVSQGGTDEPDNLVYSCHACNEFKGDHWRPDSPQRLLHPRRDNLAEHIALSEDGTLHGLTQTGIFHIRRLRLNRPELVAHRLEEQLLEADRTAYRAVVTRLAELEQQLATLEAELEALQEPPPADQS